MGTETSAHMIFISHKGSSMVFCRWHLLKRESIPLKALSSSPVRLAGWEKFVPEPPSEKASMGQVCPHLTCSHWRLESLVRAQTQNAVLGERASREVCGLLIHASC